MTRTKWIFVCLLAVAVAAIAGFQIFKVEIAERLYARAVDANMAQGVTAELPDGLHVFICGAGSPFPDPRRAGPCFGIIAGDHVLVIDTGSGGPRNLTRIGFPLDRLDHVFLTHLHSDHIDGLGELLMQAWVTGGRDEPVPVHGPAGVSEVVAGFNAAYRIDGTFRTAHHGFEVANPAGRGGVGQALEFVAGTTSQTVLQEGDLTVTAFLVHHEPASPALGYRIDHKGRSVTFSGDTLYSDTLVSASQGVDILFHDALNPQMVAVLQRAAARNDRALVAKILGDIPDYHATPIDAARAARDTGAHQLVLVHMVPPLVADFLGPLFMNGMDIAYDGPVTPALDGMLFSLPAGSTEIDMKELF